jgi:hypothetical protein
MIVRTVTIRRNNKEYTYRQLVESYRRDDGKPAVRVLANLSNASPILVENLHRALMAARNGEAVVLASEVGKPLRIERNLEYLSLAILRDTWRKAELHELLDSVLAAGEREIRPAEVVEALVFQRCTDPSPKYTAPHWLEGTAIPELTGIVPAQFNNTRIHRTLDLLDTYEAELQKTLVTRRVASGRPFVSMFVDITDTWFEGHGPEMAKPGRDKEGIYRRRVGILMLCDEGGVPLRWRTLSGDYRDPPSLARMFDEIKDQPWTKGVPVAVDRALGRAGSVTFLASTGLEFITTVPVDEFANYDVAPPDVLAGMDVGTTKEDRRRVLAKLAEIALAQGFQRVRDDRYVLDRGIVSKAYRHPPEDFPAPPQDSRAVIAMRLARRLAGEPTSQVAEELGVTTRALRNIRMLRGLREDIQRRVLAGEADSVGQEELIAVARLPEDKQDGAFESLLLHRAGRKRRIPKHNSVSAPAAVRLRVVVHFNPERFVEQRRTAAEKERELQDLVQELNRQIGEPTSRRKDTTVLDEVRDALRKRKWVDVYTVSIERLENQGRRVRLTRDDEAWKKRQATDGFNVMAASTTVSRTAGEIVDLYFAKDMIEKDFQVMKSVIELRPVWHRTNAKVRAHVSLCVLALYLQRLLEQRLRAAGVSMSATRAHAEFESCKLNRLTGGTYTLTQPTSEQIRLVGILGLAALLDDRAIEASISKR